MHVLGALMQSENDQVSAAESSENNQNLSGGMHFSRECESGTIAATGRPGRLFCRGPRRASLSIGGPIFPNEKVGSDPFSVCDFGRERLRPIRRVSH